MNHSRQRDLIMDYLAGTKSHPTAEEVYENVSRIEPNISLGTVYRNLNLLSDNKMIIRIHTQDGVDHFDADTRDHYHFYCTKCGRVYDLEMEMSAAVRKLVRKASEVTDCRVEGCMIYFHGICNNCEPSKG